MKNQLLALIVSAARCFEGYEGGSISFTQSKAAITKLGLYDTN
jgi:hypothetical protein